MTLVRTDPRVRVTVVTFRRPALLARALGSLRAQSFRGWRAEVLNDDPADPAPAGIVAGLADPRIAIVEPGGHRGGTANFNAAFRPGTAEYGSLLEDDNWWEPDFLNEMVGALDARPAASLATANERVWIERDDGNWSDSGLTLRPPRDVVWELDLAPDDKCGRAMLANSALLFRLPAADDWRTPDGIPVDVTEHYRERVVPHPLVVHDRVLVNFAQTTETHRSRDPLVWSVQQMLLIGSVFAALHVTERRPLADRLLAAARVRPVPERVALMLTGRYVPAASALWEASTIGERLRAMAHVGREPSRWRRYRRLLNDHADEWRFLREGWVAEALAVWSDETA